jgi:GntR family transcriptional regulator, transcriptional repressor for pyruvate dehydrogenase complex
LRENLQTMIQRKADFAGFAELDSDFHLLIAKASNNPIMPLVIEPIRKLMPQINLALYDFFDDATEIAVGFHMKIFQAIEAQEEDTARLFMHDHLKKAEQHIRLTLERKPHSF